MISKYKIGIKKNRKMYCKNFLNHCAEKICEHNSCKNCAQRKVICKIPYKNIDILIRTVTLKMLFNATRCEEKEEIKKL